MFIDQYPGVGTLYYAYICNDGCHKHDSWLTALGSDVMRGTQPERRWHRCPETNLAELESEGKPPQPYILHKGQERGTEIKKLIYRVIPCFSVPFPS